MNKENEEIYQDSSFYFNREYVSPKRLMSFYEQLNLLVALEVSSLLEIGVGNGVFQFLAKKYGVQVKTLDHNSKLSPDYHASILDPLPLSNNQFELVAAFEVLEHLPLKYMPSILKEFSRVAGKYILFSVPDRNWYVRLMFESNYFSLNKLLSFRRLLKVWEPVDDLNPDKDMHYWHIGDKGVTPRKIIGICSEMGLVVERSFRSKYNPSHHFFLLRSE